MNKREFREQIEAILARQREERLEALREEVRAEERSPTTETKRPKKKAKRHDRDPAPSASTFATASSTRQIRIDTSTPLQRLPNLHQLLTGPSVR